MEYPVTGTAVARAMHGKIRKEYQEYLDEDIWADLEKKGRVSKKIPDAINWWC